MKLFKTCLCFIGLVFWNYAHGQISIDPSDNFCYAKLKTPDVYDEVNEEVLVYPASTKTKKIPAEYEIISEQVLMKPETKQIHYIPATYKTVLEEVIDRPASSKIITIPAVKEIQKRKVLIKEESTRLVVVPAVYENITERIMIKPEERKLISVPAEYETITEKVIAKAAAQRFETIPAEYETITEKVEVQAATIRIETMSPSFKTIKEEVLLKPAYTKWVEKRSSGCLSADPDDCQIWCLVEVPAEYETVTRRINIGCDGSGVANSGCTKEVVVPAKYESRPRQILKSPASSRAVEIPAEYTTVTRSILKTPATTKEEVIPAVYKSYTKRIIKTPATVREEIVPAIYDEIDVEVIVTPATTREETIPATYKTISKRIIETSATTREEIIPAQYETISKRILKSPERVEIMEIPAKYKTVSKRVLREKGDMQWRRIVCPQHQTRELNMQLQKALGAAGFNPGPIDGIFGSKTYAAMIAYQKANNMWNGYLDYVTVHSLDLSLPEHAYYEVEGNRIAKNTNGYLPVANTQSTSDGNDSILSSKGNESSSGGNSTSAVGNSSGSTSTGNSSTESTSTNSTSSSNETSQNDTSETNESEASSSGATSMSSDEMKMIDEINLMRRDPKGYVKYVEDYIKQVENDPGLDASYKSEEITTARELIDELKNLSPLSVLKPHEGLHQVGIKHGKDVQKQGMIGHRGSDGTMPWDRVKRDTELKDGNENLVAGGNSVRESFMILLVDSGIPGRGHRKALLEPKWTHVGVNEIGDVGGVPNAWIQVFGNE